MYYIKAGALSPEEIKRAVEVEEKGTSHVYCGVLYSYVLTKDGVLIYLNDAEEPVEVSRATEIRISDQRILPNG